MLALELLTDEVPFHDKALPSAVIYALMKGERPKHPLSPKVVGYGLCDELWQALWGCWESSPVNRLSLQLLHEILDNLAVKWLPPSPAGPNHVQSSITVSDHCDAFNSI
jgi:hypothetical protein